ncbi:MAG: hypothetical protein AB8G15_02210 [Saprospiraceae bacterium]
MIKSLPLKTIVGLLVLNVILSAICLYFWKIEMGTGFIVSIEGFMRNHLWRPHSAVLVCTFLGISQTLALRLLKGVAWWKALTYGASFFVLSLLCFFYYKNMLCRTCLTGLFKISVPCHLIGVLLITPVFTFLLKLQLQRLLIPCSSKIDLHFWWSILGSLVLGAISYFSFNYRQSMSPLDLRMIQFGHPIFWLFFLLNIPFLLKNKVQESFTLRRPSWFAYSGLLAVVFLSYAFFSFNFGKNWVFHVVTPVLMLVVFLIAYRGNIFFRNLSLVILSLSLLFSVLFLLEERTYDNFAIGILGIIINLILLRLTWSIKRIRKVEEYLIEKG